VHGDAFFASVEKILIPKLSGKAVLIGRDLVWSASDEAKLRGVKIGMSLRDALRICPKAVVVAGEHERYAGFADRVRRVLESFTAAVEISALGGFYLNCAETGGVDSNFEATLRRLQKEILERTGLSVSIGAGRSKVLALVASQLERPRGLRVVEPDAEETFLAALPVETLRGVGDIEPVILKEHGVSTIGQLRLLPKPVLVSVFGEAIGLQLWNAGRGRDLVPPRRKAVWQAVFAVAKLWAFGNPARLERRMAAS
jgi:DNA polymerase-4